MRTGVIGSRKKNKMKVIKKIRNLFRCSHCRKRVRLLEKEVAYWKEKALNFKKFHI